MNDSKVTNVIIAGLGGQGVLKSSDILGDVVFATGLDIKKSEVHGMSQRGGSVASDVRFGRQVLSPMVPPGEADYLVCLASEWIEVSRPSLKEGGVMIEPSMIDEKALRNKKSINVALLGALSAYLPFEDSLWHEAIKRNLPEKLHEVNLEAFALGRRSVAGAA